MKTAVYVNGKRETETEFKIEDELEECVLHNSKTIFGLKTVYINAKKLVKSKSLGGAIPDGFLFNITDKESPEFYMVEVELAKHDFYKHIFPQVTKFLSFFKSEENKINLVNAVWTALNEDSIALDDLKSKIGGTEIYKFLKDTIDDSQNILILLDDMKPEFEEITKTYTDTWDKIVRVIILKHYGSMKNGVITITPDFEQIEFTDAPTMEEEDIGKKVNYTEEYHIEGIDQNIKDIYFQIKKEMIALYPSLVINPQKYYISFKSNKNFAYLKIRRKKIRLIVLVDENRVKEMIKSHEIHHLSGGVQRYLNGPCCEINIEELKDLTEIINILKEAKSKTE